MASLPRPSSYRPAVLGINKPGGTRPRSSPPSMTPCSLATTRRVPAGSCSGGTRIRRNPHRYIVSAATGRLCGENSRRRPSGQGAQVTGPGCLRLVRRRRLLEEDPAGFVAHVDRCPRLDKRLAGRLVHRGSPTGFRRRRAATSGARHGRLGRLSGSSPSGRRRDAGDEQSDKRQRRSHRRPPGLELGHVQVSSAPGRRCGASPCRWTLRFVSLSPKRVTTRTVGRSRREAHLEAGLLALAVPVLWSTAACRRGADPAAPAAMSSCVPRSSRMSLRQADRELVHRRSTTSEMAAADGRRSAWQVLGVAAKPANSPLSCSLARAVRGEVGEPVPHVDQRMSTFASRSALGAAQNRSCRRRTADSRHRTGDDVSAPTSDRRRASVALSFAASGARGRETFLKGPGATSACRWPASDAIAILVGDSTGRNCFLGKRAMAIFVLCDAPRTWAAD